MIPYDEMREAVARGLKDYLGVPVIRGNQTAPAPKYPYITYNVTTIASANNGSWQRHEDGKDRKLVRSIWSFTALAGDWDSSVQLAIAARDWLEHVGHTWLSDRGIIVSRTTDITNRDNVLTVDYERKNGFDAYFAVYDAVDNPREATGYIESAVVTRKTET